MFLAEENFSHFSAKILFLTHFRVFNMKILRDSNANRKMNRRFVYSSREIEKNTIKIITEQKQNGPVDFVCTQTLIISILKAQFFTITILTFSILVAPFTIFILVRFGRPKKASVKNGWSHFTSCLHLRNIVHIINKRATRDQQAAGADTHAPCWEDSAHATVGSLDPRVIQESGLTHTFLLQVWSNRQAAAAQASSHSPTASSGKTDRTQTLLDVTLLKVEEEFKKKKNI